MMIFKGKKAFVGWVAVLGALWLAFSCVGLSLHQACEGAPKNHLNWTDIAGYDSEGYVAHFASPVGLSNVGLRHPLMGVVALPVIAIGMTVSYRLGLPAGCKTVLCCFALIGTLSCLLLHLVLKKTGVPLFPRIAALFLWLSFAYVWILSGVAESFGLSMFILLGCLLMVVGGVRDPRAWLAVSVLAGCVTVTNLVKPLAAWLVAAGGLGFVRRHLSRRNLIRFGLVVAGIALAGFAAACCKWTFYDGIGVIEGVRISVRDIAECLPEGVSFAQRFNLAWNAFWCEPMMLHERVIGRGAIQYPYDAVLPHVLGAVVLLLCLLSAIRNRRLPIVRAALTMAACDVFLHVVIGWGLTEGQIYCGHWFYVIPLLLALLPFRAACLVLGLAFSIALVNLTVIL